jgi:cytochrome P450
MVGSKYTGGIRPISNIARFARDPLNFFESLAREGDVVPLKLLGKNAVFVSNAELVHQVLVRNHENYTKDDPFWRGVRALMGHSVVTDEGAPWAAQRRPMKRVFDHHSFEWSTPLIGVAVDEMLDAWSSRPQDREFDISAEMRSLNLRIGARIISGSDDEMSQAFGDAFEVWHEVIADFSRVPFPPLNWPSPRRARLREAKKTMEDSLFGMLVQRIRDRDEDVQNDVLSQLLDADDKALVATPEIFRDNVLSLRLGTYENQSTTLSWAWYWLTEHQEIMAKAVAEAREVIGDDEISSDHLPRLGFIDAIVRETLRITPSIWFLMRQAKRADRLGGHVVRPGTVMIMSPYTVQRDPAYWPDPLRFDPDRFLGKGRTEAARFAYLPFGRGPHTCLASNFALQQMVVILAVILRRVDVRSASSAPVRSSPLIAMRPSRPILVHATDRIKEKL